MKRRLLLTVGIAVILLILIFGEKRSFYCLGDNKCITVWKTYGNTCYIMPYKYYGIIRPSDNYLVTSNVNDITVFWSTELPKCIAIIGDKEYQISNEDTSEISIYNYQNNIERFDSILYEKHSKTFSDIRENADLISVYIEENYATDKNGKILD